LVQVIVELYGGVVTDVEVFQFKEDAEKYYVDNNGSALETDENSQDDYEIKWFKDLTVRCMPIESPEEIAEDEKSTLP